MRVAVFLIYLRLPQQDFVVKKVHIFLLLNSVLWVICLARKCRKVCWEFTLVYFKGLLCEFFYTSWFSFCFSCGTCSVNLYLLWKYPVMAVHIISHMYEVNDSNKNSRKYNTCKFFGQYFHHRFLLLHIHKYWYYN